MRDVVDGQLETIEDRRIGRVADLAAEWREDGSLVVTEIVVGPEALTGRISRRLGVFVRRRTGARFEHRIAMSEVEEVGPTVHLRGHREDYPLHGLDDWLNRHVIRFIPGGGK